MAESININNNSCSFKIKSEENRKINKNKTKNKRKRKEDGNAERGKTVRVGVTVIYSVIKVIIVCRAERVQTIRQQAGHRGRDQRRQHGLHWLERLDGGHVEEDHLALLRLRAAERNLRGQDRVILRMLVRREVRVRCGV